MRREEQSVVHAVLVSLRRAKQNSNDENVVFPLCVFPHTIP